MDSRGSSVLGRASSSEDSTSNAEGYDRSQSFQNYFFESLRKDPDMANTLHEVNEEEKTAQNTTNSLYRMSSKTSRDAKESDNEDVVCIISTVGSGNNKTATITQATSIPFRFGVKAENTEQDLPTKIGTNTEPSDLKPTNDDTLITINTITKFLKQIQELTDKESTLLKEREKNVASEDSTLRDNENNRKTIPDNRRKSRPQLLMKKMKSILSASNLSSESLKKDVENNEVPTSDKDLLKALRSEKLQMSIETLNAVDSLRATISEHMPGVVRRRAKKCSSVSPSPSINGLSLDDELPLLLGRCFNLSLNLKILSQCNYADPGIGCRVFVDFDVLENYLRRKIQECEVALDIIPNKTEDNLLCPKQLETKINSLSLKNQS